MSSQVSKVAEPELSPVKFNHYHAACENGFDGTFPEFLELLLDAAIEPLPKCSLLRKFYYHEGTYWFYVLAEGWSIMWTDEQLVEKKDSPRSPKFRGEYSSVHYLPSSDIIEGDTASVFRVPYVYDSGAWWKKD